MLMIENISGRFYIDDAGVLQHFACGAKNNLSFPHSSETKSLFQLHIPEGICALPPNAFRGYAVRTDVTFPDSLRVMHAGAFSGCDLGHVVLPKRAALGTDVFSGSCIAKVTIPEEMDPGQAQQAAHALRFTRSSDVFHDLAKDWSAQYADIFHGRNESIGVWKQIHNSSGTFFLDSDGVLQDFSCDDHNVPRGCSGNNPKKVILRLHIPEGVRVIPGELFADYTVLWELTFPETLKCIGTMGSNGFAGSKLPDMVLPKKLELLGHFSFGHCTIRSVTIPGSLRNSLNYPGCVRDFKDSLIGRICAPAEYRELLEELARTWHYGTHELECGALSDPALGQLCYVKLNHGLLRGGEILPRLLQEIACNG